MSNIWVVGQVFPKDQNAEEWEFVKEWELQGVFSSETLALKCIDDYDGDLFFIAREKVDVPFPIEAASG